MQILRQSVWQKLQPLKNFQIYLSQRALQNISFDLLSYLNSDSNLCSLNCYAWPLWKCSKLMHSRCANIKSIQGLAGRVCKITVICEIKEKVNFVQNSPNASLPSGIKDEIILFRMIILMPLWRHNYAKIVWNNWK